MQNFTDQSENHSPEQALAVEILTWLAGEPELLSRFTALTGVNAGELRALSQSHGFEAAMIGFIAGHEPTLMAFCHDCGVKPETVSRAWQKLEYDGQVD
ncbi:DUF3572 domain-containing protein [Martelella soudanensis]|uniref:DUF3572 domain-containing protein n=1 Tax=unclassified Martelella TaxID=2629616 RepID=UPI0015DEFDE9|nr:MULTISPECIES: DUF3572 domain-containing protein [unclassified Martelella]